MRRPPLEALAALLLASLGAACRYDAAAATAQASNRVTFTRDVAPIVFAHCAPCHRPGGAGPFPLLTYAEVRRRSREIVDVTRARVMPPWPPVEGHGRFKGERRLTPSQIETLARWAADGAVERAGADLPPAPRFTDGWQLDTPDLLLTPDRAWTLPAEGDNLFRNFRLSGPVAGRTSCCDQNSPGTPECSSRNCLRTERMGSQATPLTGPGFPFEPKIRRNIQARDISLWEAGKATGPAWLFRVPYRAPLSLPPRDC